MHQSYAYRMVIPPYDSDSMMRDPMIDYPYCLCESTYSLEMVLHQSVRDTLIFLFELVTLIDTLCCTICEYKRTVLVDKIEEKKKKEFNKKE